MTPDGETGLALAPPANPVRLVAAPHPFLTGHIDLAVAEGLTLQAMLDLAQPDPVLRQAAHIFVGDQRIDRAYWHAVRPKAGVTVTIRVVPLGGGGSGSKNPLRTILSIAVLAGSLALAGPVAGMIGLGGEVAFFGISGTQLVGAGLGLVGTLLVNALAPPALPSLGNLSGQSRIGSPTLSIAGARNSARLWDPVPRVLGIHRQWPPLGAKTYTEQVGDDQYFRMLVTWGYGPIDISDVRIGENAIGNFDDVEIETVEGASGDPALTLFTNQVSESVLAVALTEAASWQIETSDAGIDEFSVDISFLGGLVTFDDAGNRTNRSVTVEIEYRRIDTSPDGAWTAADDSPLVTTAATPSAVRRGVRQAVTRGQYEVRLRRTTADTTSSQVFDTTTWTALRSIVNEDPINMSGLAKTAVRIRATGQLNGVIDQLNGICGSKVLDWNGAAWVEAITNNPASLYRSVLQDAGNARAVADSGIDLVALQDWHDYCAANGYTCNLVVDFRTTVRELLKIIAATGRAKPAKKDGLWTVLVDQAQSVPVQHFTPRNSWGFAGEKAFPEIPHAFRVRFVNAAQGYQADERIVYDDGYDATGSGGNTEATEFEGLDLVGVTTADLAWKHGRYHIATARLRPETYSLNVDPEYLVCTRGDLVRVQHDVPGFGLSSGRVVSVGNDGASPPLATTVTVDEICAMEAGQNYAIRFRLPDGATLLKAVDLDIGEQTTLTFTTPFLLTAAPAAGDLFMFGTQDSETVELVVRDIIPGAHETAQLRLVDAAPGVHNAGVLPQTFAAGAVDSGADTIALAANPFFDGDVLRFASSVSPADLPAPLAEATDYHVVGRTATTIQVAASAGGSAIDLTDGGSGTHTATRQIPDFDSQIAALADLPQPNVVQARSSGEVLFRHPDGSLESRILLDVLKPSGLSSAVNGMQGRFRVNGTDDKWQLTSPVHPDANELSLRPVEDAVTYEYQTRYLAGYSTAGAWTASATHTVQGKTAAPSDVTGFVIEQQGDVVSARWDQIVDLDRNGYELRLTSINIPVNSAWWDSASILKKEKKGNLETTAAIPPGTWTVGIKALDTSGNYSTNATTRTLIVTSSADVISQVAQAIDWPGLGYGLSTAAASNGDDVTVTHDAGTHDGLTNCTLEAWVRVVDAGTTASDRLIMSKGGILNLVLKASTTATLVARWDNAASPTVVKEIEFGALTIGKWHHVALVKTGDIFTPYLDGATPGSTPTVGGTVSGDSSNWEIFARAAGETVELDEVRLWTVVRTAGEIESFRHRALTGHETGLAAYYPFDDGTAADGTDNGNDGVIGGGIAAVRSPVPGHFVRDVVGRLVPEQTRQASEMTDAEIFESFAPYAYDTCTYDAPEVDLGFDSDDVRVYAAIDSALGSGVIAGVADPDVEIDYRDAAGSYDGFEDWPLAGLVDFRYLRARLVLSTDPAAPTGGLAVIEDFTPIADAAERVVSAEGVTVPVGGLVINFTPPFHQVPHAQLTAHVDGSPAVLRSLQLQAISTSAATIVMIDKNDADVGGVGDYTFTGP